MTADADLSLTTLADRCVADPDDEAARLHLAARLQRLGRDDVAAKVGGGEGAGIARFARTAGLDVVAVAECLCGRVAWADLSPAHTAAVFALILRREAAAAEARSAVIRTVDEIAAAVRGVQAATSAGLDAIGKAIGQGPADDLLDANRRLAAVGEAVGQLLLAAFPLGDMAEGARAEQAAEPPVLPGGHHHGR